MIFKMLDTSTMHRRWLGAIGARGVAPRERIMQARARILQQICNKWAEKHRNP